VPRQHIPPWVLILWLAPTFLAAQSDRTDEFIRDEMRRQNIPGLSLAVLMHGKTIKTAAYGFSNIKQRTPATPETIYQIASVSKQFIAAGVMSLVQDGQLDLGDSISMYLKDAPSAWGGITIRHLLTHTSGLVRESPGFDPLKVQSDAAVIRAAYAIPLLFAPGARWEYSNLGYFVLAEVMRVVTGRPWADYLNERIFSPLGMTSTYPTNTKIVLANRAQGYVDNNALRDAAAWPALRPSGAFLSTVLDLAKWDAALITGGILTDSTRRQMWTPVTLNDGSSAPYGFGWMLANVRGHRLVHHPGGMPGARADIARFVDDELTVIVLMNLDDVDIDAIVLGVATLYLPTPSPTTHGAGLRPRPVSPN
jgi:CubicO group peptidase (beta-lactamase class C family)